MMRQASSRNQRNKGLRLKNVLQICLLAAVFFWLLYQLKHSYDKRKALDEHNVIDSGLEFIDLGRKDLPHDKVTVSEDKSHKKEDENEEVEEEEDGGVQREMEEEEAKEIGDDRIDELDSEQGDEQDDQERGDEDAEDGEESINEEDKDDQVEEEEFLDDLEHDNDSSREAREESYRRDDASSAVHRENHVSGTNEKNGSMDEGQPQNNERDVETEDAIDRKDDAPKDNNNRTFGQELSLTINGASVEKIGQELSPPDNQTLLQFNSTVTSVSDNHVNLQTDSAVVVTSNGTEDKTNNVPLGNGTLSKSSVKDHNTTIALGSLENGNSNWENVVKEQSKKSNTTMEHDKLEELSTVSLDVKENGHEVEGEPAGSSHRMVIQEERDARIDLSTLPDTQNDVKNVEYEAAE